MASVRTSVPGSGYGSAYVDALIWGGTAWDPSSGPITYHFGEASDLDSASQVHHGDAIASVISLQDRPLDQWTSTEKDAFRYATGLYSSVSGLRFQEVDSVTDANMVWWQAPLNDEGLLGIHEIPTTEAPQIWGAFNSSATFSWSYLAPGGSGLNTIIHELGHGVGLAHPHDGGGDPSATVFPGVSWPGDTGDRRLNQGLATIMSYNDGYDRAARSGPFGGQGGLGAFDIAALQALYGANMSTRTGDDVYHLPLRNAVGTGWFCIWDADGIDTISGQGAKTSMTIDLRAATLLKGAAGGAGFASQAGVIGGGFTIAHGVVIENAIGGSAGDHLIGNGAANVLNGGGGADRMEGRGGDDTYYVNSARDLVIDTSGHDTVYASTSYTLQSAARIEHLLAANPSSTKAMSLTGSGSSNAIIGNAGANVIDGKGGNDVLTGGLGHDAFVFDTGLSSRTNVDHILDFSVKDDTIRLDHAVFTALAQFGVLAAGAFHVTASSRLAHDGDDHVIYSKATGGLYFDPDGVGGGGAVKFAQLDPDLKLTANDFFVV